MLGRHAYNRLIILRARSSMAEQTSAVELRHDLIPNRWTGEGALHFERETLDACCGADAGRGRTVLPRGQGGGRADPALCRLLRCRGLPELKSLGNVASCRGWRLPERIAFRDGIQRRCHQTNRAAQFPTNPFAGWPMLRRLNCGKSPRPASRDVPMSISRFAVRVTTRGIFQSAERNRRKSCGADGSFSFSGVGFGAT